MFKFNNFMVYNDGYIIVPYKNFFESNKETLLDLCQ